MKRLIRNIKSGEYFHDGQWTPDPELAQHFANTGVVIDTCLKYHLSDVELVLQLSNRPQDACDTHVRLFDFQSPMEVAFRNEAPARGWMR